MENFEDSKIFPRKPRRLELDHRSVFYFEEQKKLLDDLQQSHDQLKVILDGITDGVMVFNRDGHIIYANHLAASMCGFYSVQDMMTKSMAEVISRYDLFGEDGLPFPFQKLPGHLTFQGVLDPPETILQFRSKMTGQKSWVLVNANPILGKEGEVLYAVSIFRDFTKHKESENALKSRESSLRLLADAGVILNSSLDYLTTLRQLCQLIVPQMADWCTVDLIVSPGEAPNTIVWHGDPKVRSWADDYQKKYRQDWSSTRGVPQVVRSGKSELYKEISDEMLVASAKNPEHLAEVRKLGMSSIMMVPILGSRQTLGAITFIASESGRRYSELDLTSAEDLGRRAGIAIEKAILFESEKSARALAEKANKAKSTFLANMSHEIRTPLNALIGFNEILRSNSLSPEGRSEYHDIIQRNGEHLLRLIDDILDLSKVEAGHLDMEFLKISLPNLLGEIESFMRARATAKNLLFTMETIGDIPTEFVTDPTRLKQILNNIIGNALKFTSSGQVKAVVRMDEPRSLLVFTVSDTGIGIRQDVQNKLFQPFSQADASVTRRYGGTGLGLILSKKLAQGLGGDLFLKDSREGQGTTFVIEVTATARAAAQSQPPEKRAGKTLEHRKILVVDDALDNQILIENFLKKTGAQLEFAENGLEGVSKALSGDYDVVLMDVQMPIVDGYSATRQLRGLNYRRPIIALTAHAMQDDRRKCLEAGCTDYLTKPIRAEALIQMIGRHI